MKRKSLITLITGLVFTSSVLAYNLDPALGWYRIATEQNLNKGWDMSGCSSTGKIQLWEYTGNCAGQRFYIQSMGYDHRYKIIPEIAQDRRIENPGNGGNGTQLSSWYNNGDTWQQWWFTEVEPGMWTIKCVGNSKFVDLSNNAYNTDGTRIQVWDGAYVDAQHWHLIPCAGAATFHADFQDNFNGGSVDGNKWYFNTEANFNGEAQCYTNSNGSGGGYNADVGDGTLKIRVLNNNPWCFGGTRPYSSSRLITKGRFAATGGMWEARMHVFSYNCGGLWPAWWLLGDKINEAPTWGNPYFDRCWPMEFAREVDIFEWWTGLGSATNNSNVIDGNGCQAASHHAATYNVGNVYDWHTYNCNFDSDGHVKVSVDGALKYNSAWYGAPAWQWNDEKMFTILNFAMGGMLGGNHWWNGGAYAGLEVTYVRHLSWY